MTRSIVAIGGPHGSGKSTIAKRLAVKLNMNYVSAGIVFRELAKERNLSLEELSKITIYEPGIDKKIDQRTLELGAIENTIVDAQLAAHFTPKDAIIRISITASPEVRWERIAKRDGISLEHARSETEIREKSERDRFLKMYNIDILDDMCYDVVVNNNRLSEEQTLEIVEVIVSYVLLRENEKK